VDRSKIVELTLGADTNIFYFDAKARNEIRNKLNIQNGEITLIFACKLEKSGMFPKRVELLIDAFKNVSKKQSLKLIIIGSGESDYINELKLRVKKYNIKDKVHFFDFQPQNKLREFYSAADIGVWPAQATMTIIEGMACKLAIVIPDRKTVNHLVSNNNGFLFSPGDLDDLTQKLTKLVSDKIKLNQMRDNSVSAVKKNLNYRAITKKVVDVYKKCIEQ
jgi:glycosyltransferase involved in cell wall biosynthesis